MQARFDWLDDNAPGWTISDAGSFSGYDGSGYCFWNCIEFHIPTDAAATLYKLTWGGK